MLLSTLSTSRSPSSGPSFAAGRVRAVRASAGAVLAIVAGLLVGPVPMAGAQESALFADQGAWFWSSNSKVTTCGGGFCGALSADDGANLSGIGATPTGALSPISTGHIGVSLKNGSSDMRGYLKFDLGPLTRDLPLGSRLEFSQFLLQLTASHPTDTDHTQQHSEFQGKAPATSNQQSASILACAVTVPWGPAEGDPTASTTILPPDPDAGRDSLEITTSRDEPLYDCSNQALGVASPDGSTWQFDITSIANKWASLELFNEGVALLPVNQNLASTWTVEFHGPPLTVSADGEPQEVVSEALGAHAEVAYSAVPEEEAPTTGPPGPPGPPGVPSGPIVTPPLNGGDSGGGNGTTPPVVQPPTGPLVRVANSGTPETPAWLFALIPIGLLGLGLTSSALGPEGMTVGSGNRVAQILRARRLDGSAAGDLDET